MKSGTSKDVALIAALGGPANLARLLGYARETGTQRVQNWTTRGIPVRVKYERPDLFASDGDRRAEDRRHHDDRRDMQPCDADHPDGAEAA